MLGKASRGVWYVYSAKVICPEVPLENVRLP